MSATNDTVRDLTEITEDGRLRLHFHPGQWRAWESEKRFVTVLAGTQGGKTSFGPHWLYREIQRRGPGDYIVATPTFALLGKKCLPEFLKLFEGLLGLGRYHRQDHRFAFNADGSRRTFGTATETPTNVWFGYAEDPESLESATAKAAWLDEAGQKKFKLGSWEAILRRLSLAQGRVLLTTTPYDLGWLKQQVYDKFTAGATEYDVIRFDSTENPAFPREEFERARRDLPAWKFDLFYRAMFTRPAGLIYDSFADEMAPAGHKVKRFPIEREWPRYVGLDFGAVNTAAVFFAEDPRTKTLYLYRTYLAGGRTAAEHVAALLAGEPPIDACCGGSHSEDQWRSEFRAAGLLVREPPIRDVEVGIDRVYGCHSRSEIMVFDDLAEYLAQKTTYSREVDEAGTPLEKIADKETFHLLDAERYIIAYLRQFAPRRKSGASWRGKTGGLI